MVEVWKSVVLENYANFKGRAGMAEYWWFVLANIVAVLGLLVLSRVSGLFFVVYLLYILGVFIPGLAVSIRRLHDTDRSGWWYLIGLIPFGGIVLLVFAASQGTVGPNSFGPDPRALQAGV
jgi:uncharacterized membrane protein YhaH (DUF805 family)